MKTDELRNIPIEEVLSKYGHEPVRRYGGYLMYRSPFREDHAPSFRVTLSGNHWRDYGDDSHGSVIDLVMRMEHCDTGSAIRKLASGHFTSGPVAHTVRDSKEVSVTSKMKVLNIVPLRNRVLLDYALGRGIDADIVQKYCQEVNYCFDKNRKPCFALGFPNDAGGLELRSSMFKGCHTAKAVSPLNKGHAHCVVFEGFFDLLSFLQYARDHPELKFPKMDYCVLNSTVNASKIADFLHGHKTIHAFMDNDRAGEEAFRTLGQFKPKDAVLVNESARLYPGYNDFNDFLKATKGLRKEIHNEL